MVKKDMACVLEAAKGDLMLGLKQREASLHKWRLGRWLFKGFYAFFSRFVLINVKRNGISRILVSGCKF